MTADGARLRLSSWRAAGRSLEPHSEAGSLQVGGRVYVLGGYQSLTRMGSRLQILEIESGQWSYGPPLPQNVALSHAGLASDGRQLFVVSGQPGPACWPATTHAWALELHSLRWQPLAPLPQPRFAPILQYAAGALHLITGATEDRSSIATDHFVLRLRGAQQSAELPLPALGEQRWQRAEPIPRGGDHAASVLLGGCIYAIGGEHGHAPVTTDAAGCHGTYHVHDDVWRYELARERWTRCASMPFGSSHMERQLAVLGSRILVLGGTGEGDELLDHVQEYDPARDRWRVLRPLPAPRKGGVVWQRGDELCFNGGQLRVPSGDRPVVADTMVAAIQRGPWRLLGAAADAWRAAARG